MTAGAEWGKSVNTKAIELRGLVRRPGIGDLPYVEIVLHGRVGPPGGERWSFECTGRQITTKSLFIYKSVVEAKRAAEMAANLLLDLRVALESRA